MMQVSIQRTARCACGSVNVVAAGEPASVVACHCVDCQRRTGSVLGVGAYYPDDRITVTGSTREFVRPTESGNRFFTHFCPTCGTSMFWRSDRNPGMTGIAVGAFADPAFPAPVRSVWERSRHAWLAVPAEHHFEKGCLPK
jgi:hypothetical protein